MRKNKSKKTQGSSGGAAAAGGVGFQERVAAFAMAHALIECEDLSAVGLGSEFGLRSVHLETAHAIDDVVLIGKDCRALIQAKRSLSLSDSPNSEFSAALAQFVKHHLTSRQSGDMYVLATTIRSSEKLVFDLRKLTESVRLNTNALTVNPLTVVEQDVLTKTRKLIAHHIAVVRPGHVLDAEVDEVFSCIWVLPLDIEAGGRDEATAFAIIRSRAIVAPRLVWDALVGLAATLAQQRASIDITGLFARLGQYVKPKGETKTIEDEIRLKIVQTNTLASGKEVLIFDGLLGADSFSIGEFSRFRDGGGQRLRFRGNQCIFLDGSVHDYIFRASTLKGVERFLASNPSVSAERKVTLLPYTGEPDPNQSPWALARQELISKLMQAKKGVFRCLVCGDPISENNSLLVEIDEEEFPVDVGYAHQRCHRPSLRVLGEIQSELFAKYTVLKDFDYEAWVIASRYGIGRLFNVPALDQIVHAGWKPSIAATFPGKWCVQINLQDGSSYFATERGKVHRFGHPEVVVVAQEMTEKFERGRLEKNPWCVSADRKFFGTYSTLIRLLKPGERLLKCENAQPTVFTTAIDATYSSPGSHYAPLVVLLDMQSGRPLVMGGTVFLISAPFQLAGHLQNWKDAGLNVPEYSVGVISDDQSFDSLLLRCLNDGLQVVIDPSFDMTGRPIRGIIVERLEAIVSKN